MGTSSALLLIAQSDSKLLLPVCQDCFLPGENPTGQMETKGQQHADY